MQAPIEAPFWIQRYSTDQKENFIKIKSKDNQTLKIIKLRFSGSKSEYIQQSVQKKDIKGKMELKEAIVWRNREYHQFNQLLKNTLKEITEKAKKKADPKLFDQTFKELFLQNSQTKKPTRESEAQLLESKSLKVERWVHQNRVPILIVQQGQKKIALYMRDNEGQVQIKKSSNQISKKLSGYEKKSESIVKDRQVDFIEKLIKKKVKLMNQSKMNSKNRQYLRHCNEQMQQVMQTIQKLDGILADPKLKLRLRRVPLENPIGDPLFSKLVSHWFILGQYGNLNFRIDLHQGQNKIEGKKQKGIITLDMTMLQTGYIEVQKNKKKEKILCNEFQTLLKVSKQVQDYPGVKLKVDFYSMQAKLLRFINHTNRVKAQYSLMPLFSHDCQDYSKNIYKFMTGEISQKELIQWVNSELPSKKRKNEEELQKKNKEEELKKKKEEELKKKK